MAILGKDFFSILELTQSRSYSFDSYGWAMLSCFRLMTQDYWENLYQLVNDEKSVSISFYRESHSRC